MVLQACPTTRGLPLRAISTSWSIAPSSLEMSSQLPTSSAMRPAKGEYVRCAGVWETGGGIGTRRCGSVAKCHKSVGNIPSDFASPRHLPLPSPLLPPHRGPRPARQVAGAAGRCATLPSPPFHPPPLTQGPSQQQALQGGEQPSPPLPSTLLPSPLFPSPRAPASRGCCREVRRKVSLNSGDSFCPRAM